MQVTPLDLIRRNLSQFTKNERLIAEFILNNPHKVFQLTADDFTKEAHISKPAYIRFCKKLGFKGYAEFRFALSRQLIAPKQADETLPPYQIIAKDYADFILEIPKFLADQNVSEICRSIIQARKLKLFGMNRTALSAHQFRLRLAKIGLDAEVVEDAALMGDVANYLDKDDLLVIFSIKASSFQYLNHLKEVHSRGGKTVLFTMTADNKLSDYVTYQITLPYLSRASQERFLDDQALFFVFIEILLNEIAHLLSL